MEKQNYLFLNQADLLAKKEEFDKYMTQLRTMYAELKPMDVFNFQNNVTKGAVDNLMIFENSVLELVNYHKKSFESFNHFTTSFFHLVPGYNTTMNNGFTNAWKDTFNKITEGWESSLRENVGLNTELSIGLIQLASTNAHDNTIYCIRCNNTYADGYDSFNVTSAILYLANNLKSPSIASYHKLISDNLNSITLVITDDITSNAGIYTGINSNISFGVVLEVIDYLDNLNTY